MSDKSGPQLLASESAAIANPASASDPAELTGQACCCFYTLALKGGGRACNRQGLRQRQFRRRCRGSAPPDQWGRLSSG